MSRIVEFTGSHAGKSSRIALKANDVDTLIESDEGCIIVTERDAYHVTASFDECREAVWPREP